MDKSDNMLAIPDEFLESIAGGVMTDEDRKSIRSTAQFFKDEGSSQETVLKTLKKTTIIKGNTEDWPEIKEIILSVFAE